MAYKPKTKVATEKQKAQDFSFRNNALEDDFQESVDYTNDDANHSSTNIIRALLEVAAINKWDAKKTEKLERLSIIDPELAWTNIENEWKKIQEKKRNAIFHQDALINPSFTLINEDGAKKTILIPEQRYDTFSLINGLELIKTTLNKSPFSEKQFKKAQEEQNKLKENRINNIKNENILEKSTLRKP